MPLNQGTHLGPYEILSAIGVGGMGEVYRARDTKLGRDVALKVIPDTFALDPDRLARFQREAQVLASLNHPHIAAIYGFEDSGETHALVLELVEGETLADRIARGALPLDEALPIAKQICEALEAAHEQGIIHRDLKPANINITSDGVVKVLDFGLAKLADRGPAKAGHYPPDGSVRLQADLTMSPTITSPAMMTGVGVLLGTAAYMSPEQAKGREADKRCDIWAFGCVLFEMLTGKGPLAGDDVTDTLANVLKREPNWLALPAEVPPALRALLRRCLEKNRRERVADISTALFVLKEQASLAAPVTASAPLPSRLAPANRGVRYRRAEHRRLRPRPGDHAGRLPCHLCRQPRDATLHPRARRPRAGDGVHRRVARTVRLPRRPMDRVRGRSQRVEESGGHRRAGGHAGEARWHRSRCHMGTG
ncbi:MAG: hypothetical protein DMF87_27755 [Acidobacteria bacterium]|nr:MAG: hypothetical protein DMF87_27755 [Acidobacteriota bacterium]